MSAKEVIAEFERLSSTEQDEVFSVVATKILERRNPDGTKPFLGKKLSFNDACDLVFRENRDLLALLAK